MARKRIPRSPVRQGFDVGWLAIAIGFLIGEGGWSLPAKVEATDQPESADRPVAASLDIETLSGVVQHGEGWTDPDTFDWSAIRQHETMASPSPSVPPDWWSEGAGAIPASVDPFIFEIPAWVFDSDATAIGDTSVPTSLPVADFVDLGFAIL